MNIQFVRKSANNAHFKEVFQNMSCQDIAKELKCFDEVPLKVSKCKEMLGVLIYMYIQVKT